MHIRKPLRKWGNAYGIMISKHEAEVMGSGAGDVIDAELHPFQPANVSELPSRKAGHVDIDHVLAGDLDGSD